MRQLQQISPFLLKREGLKSRFAWILILVIGVHALPEGLTHAIGGHHEHTKDLSIASEKTGSELASKSELAFEEAHTHCQALDCLVLAEAPVLAVVGILEKFEAISIVVFSTKEHLGVGILSRGFGRAPPLNA
jgi:hypothetical protein